MKSNVEEYMREEPFDSTGRSKRELKANFNRLLELSMSHLKNLKRGAIKDLSKGEKIKEGHLKELSLCIENLECAESIYDDLCVMES